MFLDSLRYVGIGILLLFVQFFLLQQINFGSWINPMPYIFILFILPFSLNPYLKLFIAFFLGFLLDSIGDTYGMHAAACTFMMFAKIYADRWFLDTDAIQLQGYNYVTPAYKGTRFFVQYTLIFIVLHHLVFFILNYFKPSFIIIVVTLFSSIASFLFILLYRFIGTGR